MIFPLILLIFFTLLYEVAATAADFTQWRRDRRERMTAEEMDILLMPDYDALLTMEHPVIL